MNAEAHWILNVIGTFAFHSFINRIGVLYASNIKPDNYKTAQGHADCNSDSDQSSSPHTYTHPDTPRYTRISRIWRPSNKYTFAAYFRATHGGDIYVIMSRLKKPKDVALYTNVICPTNIHDFSDFVGHAFFFNHEYSVSDRKQKKKNLPDDNLQ